MGSDTIARSSGDLTSAPFPDGGSEFVDLDLALAAKHGIRYAVSVLNNYSGAAFGDLERAFAGLMYRDDTGGAYFDPRTVDLRFDLQGGSGVFLPMVFDIEAGLLHWLDMYSRGVFQFNNVATSSAAVATICPAMIDYFGSGVRTSMYDLGLLHAAARGTRVTLRGQDGAVLVRREGEPAHAFLARLSAPGAGRDQSWQASGDEPVLALLLNGDLALPDQSAAYVLKRGVTAATLSGSDLIA
jgi:hypothetical protein